MRLNSIAALLLVTNAGLLPESCAEKLNINTNNDNLDNVSCVAQPWGKTISLFSDYAQGAKVLVFPAQENKLYATIPINNHNPAYGYYEVAVYKDCTVSFKSKGNGKFVTAWESSNKTNSIIAANRDTIDRYSRYEVLDEHDGTYKFRSVALGSTLMVDSQQQLRTTRPEVTLSNDPVYFQSMKFRVNSGSLL